MAAAAPLTATHRQAQLALRARVVRDLQTLWPALDWEDIDRTFPIWARVVSTLIDRNRTTSASLASAYYRAFRFEAGHTDPLPAIAPPVLPRAQVQTVLRVTSIVSIKAAATRGLAREAAMANAFVASSGAVSRLVLDAGRETIRASTLADPKARGWERVTSGRTCDFCASLASEVYEGDANFQAHDHCGCTAQPVYL